MVCPKCGTSLPEDAKFCVACGAAVTQPMQQVQQDQLTQPIQPVWNGPSSVIDVVAPANPGKIKKKTMWIALAAAIILMAGLLSAALFLWCRAGTDAEKSELFNCDRLLVEMQTGECAYISPEGQFVIGSEENGFDLATPFGDNGLAIVTEIREDGGQEYTVIDTKGEEKAQIDLHTYFSGQETPSVRFLPFDSYGLSFFAIIQDGEDIRYGMVDETGSVVVPPEYIMLTQVGQAGFAFGWKDWPGGEGSIGFRINVKGEAEPVENLPIPVDVAYFVTVFYDAVYSGPAAVNSPYNRVSVALSEGEETFVAALDPETAQMGYIDQTGVWVIPPQYQVAGDFYYEYAIVSPDGTIYQAIDTSGTVLFEGDGLMNFSAEGLAVFWEEQPDTGRRYGFVNTEGEVVIEPQYVFASGFLNGYAWVKKNDDGLFTFIDTTGKQITEQEFVSYGSFDSYGFATIFTEDGWEYIGVDGKPVFEDKQVWDIGAFDPATGLAVATTSQTGGPFRLINIEGDLVGDASFRDYHTGTGYVDPSFGLFFTGRE